MNVVNPIELLQVVQKGVRVTLGATTSAVESLQDANKRNETLTKLSQGQWPQLVDELAVKGEMTERDARAFVDSMLAQRGVATMNVHAGPGAASGSGPISGPAIPVELQRDIRELTVQISGLRQELEQLRSQSGQ